MMSKIKSFNKESNKQFNGQFNMQKGKLLILITAGVIFGLFALLFILANDTWAPILFPGSPWSSKPYLWAFEARVSLIIISSFIIGASTISIFWKYQNNELKKKCTNYQDKIKQIETELEKTERLVSSSRNNS